MVFMFYYSNILHNIIKSIFNIQIMVDGKSHDLHVPLDKEIFEKIETIKTYHGIKNNTEIIRFLITKEYREINI